MQRTVLLFRDVKEMANKDRALVSKRYFKTGKGEYGEGDIFLGLTVPQCRLLAKKYHDLSLEDVEKILTSPIHEERLIALLILVELYKKNPSQREAIFHFYLDQTEFINNWDLIDLSADKIVGQWIYDHEIVIESSAKQSPAAKERRLLRRSTSRNDTLLNLAHSSSVWERRIAIMATFAYIKHGQHDRTFEIASILLHDTHDLIQKAVGWMLREVGKRCSEEIEEHFLKKHYTSMPRTMLRYAIEKFEEEKRKKYLAGAII